MERLNGSDLLTVDGHPIGELIVKRNPAPATTESRSEDNLVRVQREQEMSEIASDMTKGRLELEELYPGYTNDALRTQALKYYVTDRKPLERVAALVEVPLRTVSMWAYNGGWDRLIQRETMVMKAQANLAVNALKASRKYAIVEKQLDQAERIREASLEALDEGAPVRSVSEAWSTAAKVEHTVLGITGESEDGKSTTKAKEQEQKSGEVPLVMVFNGGLPPVRPTQHTEDI